MKERKRGRKKRKGYKEETERKERDIRKRQKEKIERKRGREGEREEGRDSNERGEAHEASLPFLHIYPRPRKTTSAPFEAIRLSYRVMISQGTFRILATFRMVSM